MATLRRSLAGEVTSCRVNSVGGGFAVSQAYTTSMGLRGDIDPCISMLEVLHPQGHVDSAAIIGSNRPAQLAPTLTASADEPVDLLLLCPTPTECRTKSWLSQAVQLTALRLKPDGIAYLLVPVPWRFAVVAQLRRYGLGSHESYVPLPNSASARYLVPLRRTAVEYACSSLITSASWRLRLLTVALHVPRSAGCLAQILPQVGFSVRRGGAAPLLDWVLRLTSVARLSAGVVIHVTSRRQAGSVMIYCFERAGKVPSVVVKVKESLDGPGEGAVLAELGPSARACGAEVPRPLLSVQMDGRRVLLQSGVGGRPLAALLLLQPARLPGHMATVAAWLDRWNRRTSVKGSLTREQLEQELLAPASALAPLLDGGDAYVAWLKRMCSAVEGTQVRYVAAHNDLTMWNILLDARGRLGLVDWESGRAETLPLKDFFYAIVDAVAAVGGYADRLDAFQKCFTRRGAYRELTATMQQRLDCARRLGPALVNLCFHACWLQHAVDEQGADVGPDRLSFLRIVQWLALHRDTIEWGLDG